MNASPKTAPLTELLSHSEWLRVLARKLVASEAIAEDLVQETWLVAMKNPPAADRPARPWLAGVARNLAKMGLRTESRRRHRQEVAAKVEGLPSATELVEQVETERHLASVVLGIDEPFRTTVLLHYFQNLTLAEIAVRQGVPAATARSRHARGLELLREQLAKEYGGSKSWCQALLVLAKSAPFPGDSPGGGSALAALPAGATIMKVIFAAMAAGIALWAGNFWADETREASSGMKALTAQVQRGPSGSKETRLVGSRSVGASTSAGIPGLDPQSPSTSVTGIASLRVHLIDDAPGATTHGRRMVVLDAQQACHVAEVGQDGWATFESIEEPFYLYVARSAGFTYGRLLQTSDRELWIRLDAGRSLRGQVFVDGSLTDTPIELSLLNDEPLFGGRDWPDAVSTRIFDALGMGLSAKTQVQADGSFAFVGLPDAWAGVLYIPEEFALGDQHPDTAHRHGGGELRFASPQLGVELHLKRHPRIVGRVVEANGVDGVPSAALWGEVRLTTGESVGLRLTADSKGEFQFSLPQPEVRSIHLGFSAADGRGQATIQQEYEGLAAQNDLGQLALVESTQWAVRVRSTDGQAVAGARVQGKGDGSSSAATDLAGKTFFYHSKGAALGRNVVATGYQDASLMLPPGSPVELEVVLVPDCSLKVELLVPQGVWTHGLSVVLESRSGSSLGVGSQAQETRAADSGSELEFRGLIPGQTMQLSVLGPMGLRLSTREVEALVSAETRSVVLELTEVLRKVHAAVRTPSKIRLSDVTFVANLNGEEFLRAHSDRKGSLRMDYMPEKGLSLRVFKRGYVTRLFPNDQVPGNKAREELILRVARDVKLIVAATEKIPDEVRAIDRSSGQEWTAQPLGERGFVLLDVPRGDLLVRARIMGEWRELSLPASVTSLSLGH